MRFGLALVLGSVALMAACGKSSPARAPGGTAALETSTPAADVPQTLARFVDREICSGVVTEEWTNPTNGQKIRQEWGRRAQFFDFKTRTDGFSIGYKLVVKTENFAQADDGSWTPTAKSSAESSLYFFGKWSSSLNRYVGHARWATQNRDGTAVDVDLKGPIKVTSYTAQGDAVTMKYLDTLPVPASASSPDHINSYEETVRLNQDKLERQWSYKSFNVDPITLSPLDEVQLGAQPSFDTEEKCKTQP